MLSEKCFVAFYVFSLPPCVYVGALNLIVSIPGSSILTLLNKSWVYGDKHYMDMFTCFLQHSPENPSSEMHCFASGDRVLESRQELLNDYPCRKKMSSGLPTIKGSVIFLNVAGDFLTICRMVNI